MLRSWMICLGVLVASGILLESATAQSPAYQLNHWYYYPYYYFPHNYWPEMSPKWPEAPGQPYMRPPAYQAYPAFLEPNWRYDLWNSHRYHKGFHYWLDQF